MFLKSLFISGFKSFAYPTKIEFSDNISAIVGPNGSGKSNISDAIRFVLGEQRTRLMRSHSMQDIIFSGTDSENPRGVAHVQLILGHEDQPDLVIERKYYRTGDSEYLLNGHKVRLKDIQAEFVDTGLGKNGYSIISQGGVENIVGAGPMELRELVEEAVGIAGYKVQQNETLRRLEMIQSNVERVSDILDEMKRQLRPLKKNAEKTRQYLELSNTIRDIDLVSFYDREVKFQKDQEELNSNIIDANFTIMDIDKKAEEKDSLFINNKAKRNQLEEKNTLLIKDLEQLKNNQTGKLLLNNNLERDIQNFKVKKEQLENQLNHLKETNKKNSENLKTYQSQFKEQDQLYQKLKEKTAKQEQKLNQVKSKLEEVKEKTDQRKIAEAEDRIKGEILSKIESETQLKHLNSLAKFNQDQVNKLNDENTKIESRLKTLLDSFRKDNKQKESLEKQLSQDLNRVNEITLKLSQIDNRIETTENNIDYQNRLKESYSGFSEAVKSVMNFSKTHNMDSVFGTVSDLFTTETKYQTAIQIALGYSAQNIVVKNSKAAQKLIDYLKKANKGRATFLPLDSVKAQNGKINQKLLNFPGVLGFADALIDCQREYKNIFSRLLGRTLVVEDFNTANKLKGQSNGLTLVTLSGECFYSSGAIVGGSIKKNSSQIFNPQQEINRLEKEKDQLFQNKQTLSDENKKIRARRQSTAQSYATLKEEVSEQEQEIRQLKNNLTLNQSQIKQLSLDLSQQDSLKKDIEKKQIQIGTLQKEVENLKAHSDQLVDLEKELSNKILLFQEALTDCKINENKAYQERSLSFNKISDLEKEIAQNSSTIEKIKKDIKETEETEEETRVQLKKSQQENSQNSEKVDALNNQLDLNRKELQELNALSLQIEDELKELNRMRSNEVEARSKLERKLDKIEYEQKNLQETIFEKYQQNFAMLKDQIGLLRARKKDLSKSEVGQLKKQLRDIGSVNINAIEDYNELKERYDKLSSNYNDLIESKKDIEETIENLNKTMSDQFKQKFEKLNQLFSEAFTILFEGGKARLDYVDRNDILNTGIQLFAQPPGKHLKHINLLSGGEKAMTAIALLFAFIQLNPTPFVIIDEIDAALDDNNINRFTNYIQKVKNDNQFIVITHRKGTVQMCDNIHGVSMAADGISRCCSFEISDYIEEE